MNTLIRYISVITFVIIIFAQTSFAQTANVQGVLRDLVGRAVDDGNYQMTFKLYQVSTGGTAVWEETQNAVRVVSGIFSAKLGSVTPLPVLDPSLTFYLGVTTPGGGEMVPRIELTKPIGANTATQLTGTTNIVPSTGNVGIGTKTPSQKLEVVGSIKLTGASSIIFSDNSSLSSVTASVVPVGGIIMWSGSVASIPTGWALCNGASGTPDLRGRFITGAGGGYTPGNSGGYDSYTLSESQMPVHSHTTSVSTNGSHSHSYSSPLEGTYQGLSWDQTGSAHEYPTVNGGTTTTAGDHNHSVTVYNSGGGQSFDNRPAYYALCFIMRVQ